VLRNEKLRNEAGFSVYSTFESFVGEDTIASNGVSSENFLHYVQVIQRGGKRKRLLQTMRKISEIKIR